MHGNESGNIKWISSEIEPSIKNAGLREPERTEITPAFINQVAMLNLRHSVLKLKRLSPFLEEGIKKGQIGLVAGFYDTTTGKVTFDKMEYSGSTYVLPVIESSEIA
jgi:carbonic anhydrase